MQPSNFHVDVTACGHKQFVHVMNLFFDGPNRPEDMEDDIEFWSQDPKTGLTLYSSDYQTNLTSRYNEQNKTSIKIFHGDKIKFNPKPPKDRLIEFAWNWLKNCPEEYYGAQDDYDGSGSRDAWRIYTGYSYNSPTLVIKPTWAEYHK